MNTVSNPTKRVRAICLGIVGKGGKSGNRDFSRYFTTQVRKTGSDWSDCSGIAECSRAIVPISPLRGILPEWRTLLSQALIQESGMKTRPTLTSDSKPENPRPRAVLWMMACLAFTLQPVASQAGPPTPADDIDYAASGFQLPPGVHPNAWATAAGASAAGGMNYASQSAISGPTMGRPMGGPMANPMASPMGSPASMMAMGMPGMGPNGPIMGRPGMEGPMMGPSQMQGFSQSQGPPPNYQASSIPSTFPSGPVPGMGVAPVGYRQADYGCDGMCGGSCGDPNCGSSMMGGGYPMQGYPDGGYPMQGYSDGGCQDQCNGEQGCSGGRKFPGLLSLFSQKCGQCSGQGCSTCAQRALQNDCIGYGGVFGDLANGNCLPSDLRLMFGAIGDNLAGLRECLSPYSEAGRCSPRWYDLSAEYMALSNNFSQGNQVLTTRGVGGEPVLSLNDVNANGLESGVRLSAAMILGVGGNLEVTYMGGQKWGGSASVTGNEDLYSFINEFGNGPGGPIDDIDESNIQSVRTASRFHSGEVNYRRRIVGPYCRFQGSWLAGLRYVRLDNNFNYNTQGSDNNGINGTRRFFNSGIDTSNDLFGAQVGYDFWYNMLPGIHLGFGLKGAWLQNDWERQTSISSNSFNPGATAGGDAVVDRDRLGTVMADLETTLLYRFSHEWTFRTSYHMMAFDDVINSTLKTDAIGVTGVGVNRTIAPVNTQAEFSSLVLQGFTVGLEYLW